jgi:hypothetical protein
MKRSHPMLIKDLRDLRVKLGKEMQSPVGIGKKLPGKLN